MESRAVLRNARVSARKARIVADMVRGHDVPRAIEALTYTDRKSASMIRKLIESAVANAEDLARTASIDLDVDDLRVAHISVDEGATLRRFRPRAQGRATRILKQTSHITVVLETL